MLTFDPIKNRILKLTLRLVPSVAVIIVVVIAMSSANLRVAGVPSANQLLYVSGLTTAGLALFAFDRMMQYLPTTLKMLWDRNIIGESRTEGTGRPRFVNYKDFTQRMSSTINGIGQWVVGLAFVLLTFTWILEFRLMETYDAIGGLAVVGLFIQLPIAFILGAMAWRMVIVGWKVWQLAREFELKLQLGHPDKSGGFEPLGHLCLWNALIISMVGIYLGGWGIVFRSNMPVFSELAATYQHIYDRLLVIPVVLAFVAFFVPLWQVHLTMVGQRDIYQRKLDDLSKDINKLSQRILAEASRTDVEDGVEMNKQLEYMQDVYRRSQKIPVWPFNLRLLGRFLSVQIVPVLSLFGLGEPLLDIVRGIIDVLS